MGLNTSEMKVFVSRFWAAFPVKEIGPQVLLLPLSQNLVTGNLFSCHFFHHS